MQGLEDCIPPFTRRKRRSQDTISFGPKLRKRGSSVTPEGNKGNKGTRRRVANGKSRD